MNIVRHIIEHEIIGVGGGGGGGNTIRMYDEGTYIGTFSEIDIVGTGHNAESVGAGRVAIYSPSASYSPYFNTGTATVADIATVNRNIASPTAEGNPYKIGSWSGGTVHPATNSASWTYTTVNPCSFVNLTTTIEAVLLDADGLELARHETAPITGNIDVTVNGITIRVTGWTPEYSRYRGVVTVIYDLATILPAGGRVSARIVHHNAGIDYEKTQNDVFYDANPYPAQVSGVSIAETSGGAVIKYLSGVPFYDLGSMFTVGVADIDYVNANTYLESQLVEIDGDEYGMSMLTLGSGDITGWSNIFNFVNGSYSNNAWQISQSNFRAITTTANVRARAKDWTDQSWVDSPNSAILIDTWGQQSTELAEYFTDEAFRRRADDTVWDSTDDLRTLEGGIHAQVINGVLKVPNVDYSAYMPANTRDYSGAGGRNYYRRIIDAAMQVRTSCSFHISGFTLDDLVDSRVELWVLIVGKWASWCYAHTPGLFNFGTFDGDNDPIRLASSTSNRIDVSFGTLGLDSSHTYFRLRLVINDSSINPDSIVVTW